MNTKIEVFNTGHSHPWYWRLWIDGTMRLGGHATTAKIATAAALTGLATFAQGATP